MINGNKSSAVAEMGDRTRAKLTGKWGLLCPLRRGAGSPSNTILLTQQIFADSAIFCYFSKFFFAESALTQQSC